MHKDVEYYMNLPYSMVVQHRNDEDGECYVSRVLELDGCHSHGKTKEDALENLREALEGYIDTKLAFSDPIPEPSTYTDYSGKFVLRLPKSLHYTLATEAEREGVSLNQYALYKLAK
ncbi:MAG: type II toxin-antitoxin system HicB family antitoxin [Defluviitaleaceae bacterium]|nr:type II toxin-antitoxin system HicB family antitoxin [Defluviitaleaceae bacterium]MCL2240019.1 type II toxin-antitoxin system HicB family antitoxin [Defluviitaleaceae bacterium]MCL2240688.1 type II toxin-antitoxin system HicB family antitoxin [Defluviitaleaceae bacterium]